MATRNFWLEGRADGRQTSFSGGPQAKDGEMRATLYQREEGTISGKQIRIESNCAGNSLRTWVSVEHEQYGRETPVLMVQTYRDKPTAADIAQAEQFTDNGPGIYFALPDNVNGEGGLIPLDELMTYLKGVSPAHIREANKAARIFNEARALADAHQAKVEAAGK